MILHLKKTWEDLWDTSRGNEFDHLSLKAISNFSSCQ